MNKTKATLITKGILGNIIAVHVWLLEHGRKKYAQYPSAVYVKYIKKNCRKPSGFYQSYAPYLVILDGWQDIESQSLWGKKTFNAATGITSSEAKFAAFDDGWQKDFEASTKFKNIIADYRNVNTMEEI